MLNLSKNRFMYFFIKKELLLNLIVRDLQSKHKGTWAGIGWLVIYPLLMLSVYGFVFGEIFESRWMNKGGAGEFIIMLFSGLMTFNYFAEIVNRSPSIIIGNSNYVKKIVFPLELLVMVPVGSAAFNFFISLVILFGLMFINQISIPLTAIYIVPIFLFITLAMIGISCFISALGVFFRDLSQLVGIMTTMLLFLSPVFFPASSVPKSAQWLLLINPLTYPIEEIRNCTIIGIHPNFYSFAIFAGCSVIIFIAGLGFFQKCQTAFADVI